MTTTSLAAYDGATQRNKYLADAVLSAPPARLLTMLYDRLLLDLARAEADQNAGNWATASVSLLHAQAILAELASSLKVDTWDGASGLLGIYNYASTALVNANVLRDPALTREAIDLLEPLRQTWHDAAALAPAAAPAPAAYAAGTATLPASPWGRESLVPAGSGMLGIG